MAESTVEIRLLDEGDTKFVAQLFADDMRSLGHSKTAAHFETMLRAILLDAGKTCACWVAHRTGATRPIGVIFINLYNSLKFAGPSVWIEELYVDPEQRRGGVGRLLVEHVVDWAEEKGFLGVDLEAYQTNTPAAVLYRSLGFRRLGRARFSLDFADYD